MANHSSDVETGRVGGSANLVDAVYGVGSDVAIEIRLLANLVPGSRIWVRQCEANALIAAGAAELAQ